MIDRLNERYETCVEQIETFEELLISMGYNIGLDIWSEIIQPWYFNSHESPLITDEFVIFLFGKIGKYHCSELLEHVIMIMED